MGHNSGTYTTAKPTWTALPKSQTFVKNKNILKRFLQNGKIDYFHRELMGISHENEIGYHQITFLFNSSNSYPVG